MSDKYYGKYRALVTNNEDPQCRGRIKVKCPSLLGEYESAWCMPCVPFLCNDEGIFKLPNVGDGVWIEFEGGELNKPIYVGGWFNPKRQPQDDYSEATHQFCLRTKKGHLVKIDDKNNLISVSLNKGGSIKIKDSRIMIKGDLFVTGEVTPNYEGE